MSHYQQPSVSMCRRRSADPGGDPLRAVVWVGGEHDFATREHLLETITEAARLDDVDIAVDLSGVTFMDASTIGALVLARNRLRARSLSLCVRAPSPCARRVLDLCGLGSMIDQFPVPLRPHTAPALESWVAVPVSDCDAGSPRQHVEEHATSHEPADAATQRRIDSAVAVLEWRAPS